MEIKKIQLKDLEEFVNSKSFCEMEYIPISPTRAKSYLANPNAQKNDIILYLGFIDNKLIAFRSLLPDVVNSANEQIRFAWCSGSWVYPNFRRLGFSELLLKEAYSDWEKKLMFTNYAPNSENLYLKTGWFKSIHQFEGIRAYLFPKTKKLIAKANSNFLSKTIFSIIDWIITGYSSIRLWFFKDKTDSSIVFKTIELPDQQCLDQLQKTNSVFVRGEKELKWIFENPWLSAQKSDISQKYPFSVYSSQFTYKTIKVFSENNFIGFFIFSVREGQLKTLNWHLPDGFEKEIANYLRAFCKKNKIEVAIIYKKEVAKELFKRKFPFLHLKKYGQKIYSTFQIKYNTEFMFQDGDGDVFFT